LLLASTAALAARPPPRPRPRCQAFCCPVTGIRNLENGTITLRLTVVALNSPDNCASPRAIPGCRN